LFLAVRLYWFHARYYTGSTMQGESPTRQRSSLRSQARAVGPPFFLPTFFEPRRCHPRLVDPRRNRRKPTLLHGPGALQAMAPRCGQIRPGVPLCLTYGPGNGENWPVAKLGSRLPTGKDPLVQ
jgi:hypothetical protein